MLIQLAFGKKDAVVNAWVKRASQENRNISSLITSAIRYYYDTREYMPLGGICIEDEPEPARKPIYYAKDSAFENILEDWKASGIKANTEIKRILSRGIKRLTSGEDYIISEEDVYDYVNGLKSNNESAEKATTIPVQPKTIQHEVDRVQAETTRENGGGEKHLQSKKKTAKKDFILDFLPDSCKLG